MQTSEILSRRSRPLPPPWLGPALVGAGLVVGVGAIWVTGAPAPLRWALVGAALLVLLGLMALRASRTRTAVETQRAELEEWTLRLDRRERELAERLVAFHGETEFPTTIDLVDRELDDDRLAELARKDRRVMEILDAEARIVFDRIRGDAYSEDGTLQPARIRDDALDLARRVARVYRPDDEDALLHTSVAEVAKAASRACLHLLVVLDGLPLDLKDQNLQRMYTYVRRGVKTYETYKTAAPYLEYATHVGRVGRWVLGANPLYLGSTWLLGTLAKKGAGSLGGKLLQRHGGDLLRDLIHLFGFEVAAVYGQGFRHRDANWIYGAELTDLLADAEKSRVDLRRALAEVAALRLRSEYDRVYLFRLLAEEQSARPGRFRAQAVLSPTERRSVAGRLARFARRSPSFAPGSAAWDSWSPRMAERLGTPAPEAPSPAAENDERREAASSLAALLLDVGAAEPRELPRLLAATRTLGALDSEERARLVEALEADPPYFFAAPQVSLGQDCARDYVDDLVELASSHPLPWDAPERILDVAAEAGLPRAEVRKRLDRASSRALAQRTAARSARSPRISPAKARAVLNLLEADEEVLRILPDAQLDGHGEDEDVVLLATDRRLLAFALRPAPVVVWSAEPGSRAAIPERGVLHLEGPAGRLVVRGRSSALRDLARRLEP